MKELQDEKVKMEFVEKSGYLNHFSFEVVEHTRLFEIPAGEYIVTEGSNPTYLFYLVRGYAKLYATLSNGKVSLIDFFGAPCFIGEMELVDEKQEAKAVQAIEECWCLALPMKQFREQLLNDARFLRSLCTYLNKKFYKNIMASTQNQAFPLTNRLASFILMTQIDGKYREKHTQVAEYLGVSYRHLMYVFAQFTKEGLLKKSGRDYYIMNSEALSELAEEISPMKTSNMK